MASSTSPKVDSEPGKQLNLTAVKAPNEAAAAEYYPAIYWYSMIKVPDQASFPGTGPDGNGINPGMKTQGQFLDLVKTNGCVTCHQLGNKATRTIPEALGDFANGYEAWTRRIQSGQASTNMVNNIERMGTQAALKMFGDWTDRVAEGELPAAKPQRPQGVERNVVITVWDWSNPKAYLHDATVSDKRNPTVNANGLIFGATENSTDRVPVFDPVKNIAFEVKLQVRDPKTPSESRTPMFAPSPYFGDEKIWDAQTSPHSLYYDEKGRVMFAARIRPPANPDFCKKGSDHPSAKVFPLESSGRQLEMYDPKTQKFTLINTCFPTHHVQFGFDKDNTAWVSAGGPTERRGRLGQHADPRRDRRRGEGARLDAVHPRHQRRRQARRIHRAEPAVRSEQGPPHQRGVLRRVAGPIDGTVWGSSLGFPGYVVRLDPSKPNPSETALAEVYEVPAPGYGPRGFDIDSKSVVWVPLSSGHMASFDRSKCKVLNGPTIATAGIAPKAGRSIRSRDRS